MSDPERDDERGHRFRLVYEALHPDMLRFVQRRAGPENAADVVAEAMLVVWRRFEELPALDDDARAWAFGIARHVLLNEHRGARRRKSLGVRLAHQPRATADDQVADGVIDRLDLARAWHLLSEVHQEALGLAAFESLTATQAATVLGISPVAYRLRLSRGRRALRLHLAHPARDVPRASEQPNRTLS